MTENDYDQLFRQLSNLIAEAPCHNRGCVGAQRCDFGISGCYGEECALEIVQKIAEQNYYEMRRKHGQ